MNLSALNKLPANSLGISNTEASVPDNALSRLSSTALRGADFASFLHNQVQALKNPQRQHLAADKGKLPQADAERSSRSTEKHSQPPHAKAASRQATQETGRDASARTDAPAQTSVNDEQRLQGEQAADDGLAAAQTDKTNLAAQAEKSADQKLAPTDFKSVEASPEVTTETKDTDELLETAPDLSSQAGALTTIALSDKLQIITAAQTQPSEKSVADFALAMGLDPGQVKELFGSSSAAANLKPGLSTKDMLGLNTMPTYTPPDSAVASNSDSVSAVMQPLALNTPVSSADFQALQQASLATENKPGADMLTKLDNLQIQLGAAQAQQIAVAPPPSTLSVLSMMDAQLRAEDIESLKNEFDALQEAPSSDISNLNLPGVTSGPGQRSGHNSTTPAATVFANNPDMAQTYENLSQKLTTELAARMHEKLNAGEWKMKFALKPASLGLVDVQLEMRDGKLTAQFHSDTALTQDLIQNGSQRLKDALADLGLNNASVLVGQGQSQSAGQNNPQGQTGLPAKREENRAKLTDQPGPKIAEDSGPRRGKRSQFDSYA
ncbi:MAG: hypothetical protein RLZZ566_2090 [Pseudomonadota bacterium]|jgi:flagellar hook-length control protein FliK